MRGFFHLIFSRIFLYTVLIAAQLAAIIFLCYLLHSLLPVAAAMTLAYLFSAITGFILINRNAPAEFNCAWLAVIAALPFAGAVIYYLATRRGSKKTTADDESAPPPETAYDKCVYLKDGRQYFDLLFKEFAAAKQYIYLEYYIVAKGEILEKLLSLLKDAHARGVEIKIIADGLGSALRLPKKKIKELKKVGAQIKIFNKPFPLPVSRLNFRDHRKIAVIDGKTAFLGGVNVADEYANIRKPHGYWKDVGVAVYGEAAQFFCRLFLSVWRGEQMLPPPAPREENSMMPIYDSPPEKSGFCEDAYCAAIYRADRRVYAFTPYLCIGEKLKGALTFAAKRGIDVKIIIPHIPDKKLTFELTKSFAEKLVAEGVNVYEFTPGFMHAKCLICDDALFLGSYNLDFRSMQLNYECAARFVGAIADEAADDFEDCLKLSSPLVTDRRRIRRLIRSVLRLFAPLA